MKIVTINNIILVHNLSRKKYELNALLVLLNKINLNVRLKYFDNNPGCLENYH
jgi:hypothetical protein